MFASKRNCALSGGGHRNSPAQLGRGATTSPIKLNNIRSRCSHAEYERVSLNRSDKLVRTGSTLWQAQRHNCALNGALLSDSLQEERKEIKKLAQRLGAAIHMGSQAVPASMMTASV